MVTITPSRHPATHLLLGGQARGPRREDQPNGRPYWTSSRPTLPDNGALGAHEPWKWALSTAPQRTDLIAVPMPGSAPVAMAVAGATANLNGDTTADLNGHILGDPGFAADIVIANPAGNNVIVLLGNGNGTFRSATCSIYPVGNDPVAVALGDFNQRRLFPISSRPIKLAIRSRCCWQ